MTRQHIRLKEFDHNIKKYHVPTDEYLRGAPQLNNGRAYCQQTDENGFIKTGNCFSPDFTIAVVGDSFVENIFVDELSRFESVLERRFLLCGRRVKVINAEVSGMTGLTAFNLILNKLVCIKPDLVIFVQPSNDFSALLYAKGYFNDSKRYANLVPPQEKQATIYETINENKIQIYNNIVLLSQVCKLYDINLIIATCAANSSKRQLAMMNNIIREESTKLGYQILDLDKILIRSEAFYYDKCHLNENGSNRLAEVIFEFIANNECDFMRKTPVRNVILQEQNLSICDNGKIYIDLKSNRVAGVESWLSLITRPKDYNSIYNISSCCCLFKSKIKEYKFEIHGISNRSMQQSFALNDFDSGSYCMCLKLTDELPYVFEEFRLFSLIDKN